MNNDNYDFNEIRKNIESSLHNLTERCLFIPRL